MIERAREVLRELESERTVEHLEARRGRNRKGAAPVDEEAQQGLFAPGTHPVLEEIRSIAPETMTPLEALNRLADWKKKLADS